MTHTIDFRKNAAECERMARLTNNKQESTLWLAMAAHWWRLLRAHEKTLARSSPVVNHKAATR
jgi:hypothetical protein